MHVREVGRGREARTGEVGVGDGGLAKYQLNMYEYLRPADSTLKNVPYTIAKRDFARGIRQCK